MRFKIKNGVLLKCKQPEFSRTVTIPDKVTAIGRRAFEKCSSLKRILLPEHITSIGEEAFSGCTQLRTLAPVSMKKCRGAFLPEGLQSIGDRAFQFCMNLEALTVPSTVEHIGSYAFSYCGMNYLSLPENIHYIGKMLLYGTGSVKVSFFMRRTEEDTILQIRRDNERSFSFRLPYNVRGTDDKILDLLLRKDYFCNAPLAQKNPLLLRMVESGYLTDAFLLEEQDFFWDMVDDDNIEVLEALLKNDRVFPSLPAGVYERLIDYTNEKENYEMQLLFMNAMKKYGIADDFASRFQL